MRDSSSARATKQLRTSPGGRTPNSSRNLPDEPPSSVTVTTAVVCDVLFLNPRSRVESPVPPPMATTRRSRAPAEDMFSLSPTVNIPVPYPTDHISEAVQEIRQPLDKPMRLTVSQHIVLHPGISSAHGSQLLYPVRIGQESSIQDHVRLSRNPILVSEG